MEEDKSSMHTRDFWYGMGARAGRLVSRWKRILGRSPEPPSPEQFLEAYHKALRNIWVSAEVDSNEFRRLFADALFDKRWRKLVIPLLKVSRNTVTSREIAILKFVLGEVDYEFVIREINNERWSNNRDAGICLRQVELLQKVVGKETTGGREKSS